MSAGKSGGCRSSWLSMDVIFCLVLLVCGLACTFPTVALLPKYPTHSSATAQVQQMQPVLMAQFGDSAVWIESAAQSQCSNWQPWADFSSAEDMCEAVATDVAAVDSADATAVAAQQAILIQSETVEVDAETHGVERVADSAFAQHQGGQHEATAVAAGRAAPTSADNDAATPAVASAEEAPLALMESATEVALDPSAAAVPASTGQTTAVAAAARESTECQVFSQLHQIDRAVQVSATAEVAMPAAVAVAVEVQVEVAEVDTGDVHLNAAVAFDSHSSTAPGLCVPAALAELQAALAATEETDRTAAAVQSHEGQASEFWDQHPDKPVSPSCLSPNAADIMLSPSCTSPKAVDIKVTTSEDRAVVDGADASSAGPLQAAAPEDANARMAAELAAIFAWVSNELPGTPTEPSETPIQLTEPPI